MYESRAVELELEPSHDGRTLDGYAAVFHKRTRIPDRNGDFEEQLLPGFMDRSLKQRKPVMQWDHGKDTRVGTVPIGKWTEFRADNKGYRVRGRLFDNDLVEPVRQALAAGAIDGLSFRFSVPKGGDKWERRHGGMDLRSVLDADVAEAGPVVFPAYADAKVSLRGLVVIGDYEPDDEDDLDEQARTVVAYACSWTGVTVQRGLDGGPVRVRIDYRALDGWLDGWLNDGCPPLPILREHGHDGHRHPVGHLVDAWKDEHGLRTRAVYHDTAEGRAALDDILDGGLKGYSHHLEVDETRAGADGVTEVTAASLVECGPTATPFDRGAHILSVGDEAVEARADEFESVADLLDFMRVRTGVDTATAVDRIRREERDADRHVADQVRAADALARAVAQRRTTAAEAYFTWTRFHRGADFDTALLADREEAELMAELRDVLTNDRGLVDRALASVRAPEYRSPFRSPRAAMALGR
jgi:HK97 family phage prohead protease